jgi:hypothetical protein
MRSRSSDGDGLAATLYGPCRVTTKIHGATVTVVEKTDYPFSFDVDFSIETSREMEFPLRLRVPAWSAAPTVTAAGATVTQGQRGFLVVSKKWKTGDTVRLTLRPAIEGQEAVDGTTALTYGPLVFCLPIPEKATIVQRFPAAEAAGLKDFYGYQYDPLDLASAKRPLALGTGKPAFGFQVFQFKGSSPQYPWDRSPLLLCGELLGAGGRPEAVNLLPMGSTLLRRTCFPTRTAGASSSGHKGDAPPSAK